MLLALEIANSDPTPRFLQCQSRPSIGFCIHLLLGSKYDGVFVHCHGVVAEVNDCFWLFFVCVFLLRASLVRKQCKELQLVGWLD
jgi:hypothetical protein